MRCARINSLGTNSRRLAVPDDLHWPMPSPADRVRLVVPCSPRRKVQSRRELLPPGYCWILLPFLVFATFLTCGGAAAQTGGQPGPSAAEVRQVVLQYFDDQDCYERGDLITRAEVEPLLERLRQMGLKLPNAKQILSDILTDDDFLPRQLATPAGQRFMRQISRYPKVYDRLDRLSRLPLGQQTIRDLIRGPDGYKMLEYMSTASGGRELCKMLSNSPGAGDFNAPTGRIYTAEGLLLRLEKSRAAAAKAKAKAVEKRPGR
jgi:hypothetical protein